VNRYEKQKAAVEKAMAEHVASYQDIYKKADDEGRDPTDEERLDVESHLKALEALKKERSEAEENIKTLARVDELGRELGPSVPALDARVTSEPQDRVMYGMQKTLGEAFIESKGYKDAINEYRENGGRFREGFAIPSVALEAKGHVPGGRWRRWRRSRCDGPAGRSGCR
jgi:hypothetical protein